MRTLRPDSWTHSDGEAADCPSEPWVGRFEGATNCSLLPEPICVKMLVMGRAAQRLLKSCVVIAIPRCRPHRRQTWKFTDRQYGARTGLIRTASPSDEQLTDVIRLPAHASFHLRIAI